MFAITEAEATMIRTALEQHGELAAAVELRRLFRGIGNNDVARQCVRTIAGWEIRRGLKELPNLEAPQCRRDATHVVARIGDGDVR